VLSYADLVEVHGPVARIALAKYAGIDPDDPSKLVPHRALTGPRRRPKHAELVEDTSNCGLDWGLN
jgi:hypothetical protein